MSSKTTIQKADYYTQKGGDICRTMAFGGLAFIWLLHLSVVGKSANLVDSTINGDLKLPAFLLLICLTIDAFQYLLGAILWGTQALKNSSANSADYRKTNQLLLVTVCSKLFFMVLGYVLLAIATKNLWW